jgi:hypothetical protein
MNEWIKWNQSILKYERTNTRTVVLARVVVLTFFSWFSKVSAGLSSFLTLPQSGLQETVGCLRKVVIGGLRVSDLIVALDLGWFEKIEDTLLQVLYLFKYKYSTTYSSTSTSTVQYLYRSIGIFLMARLPHACSTKTKSLIGVIIGIAACIVITRVQYYRYK